LVEEVGAGAALGEPGGEVAGVLVEDGRAPGGRPARQFLRALRAHELADRLGTKPQLGGDAGDTGALVLERVDRGVALSGALRQAALGLVQDAGWPLAELGLWGRRRPSGAQPRHQALDRVAQVAPQMPAVGDLDGARRAAGGALGVAARPGPGR
jgi:hypothetical protein